MKLLLLLALTVASAELFPDPGLGLVQERQTPPLPPSVLDLGGERGVLSPPLLRAMDFTSARAARKEFGEECAQDRACVRGKMQEWRRARKAAGRMVRGLEVKA